MVLTEINNASNSKKEISLLERNYLKKLATFLYIHPIKNGIDADVSISDYDQPSVKKENSILTN